MTIEDITAIATPASLLILCLIFVIKLRRDVNPIVLSMVKGLGVQAQSNSMFFLMMFLSGANIFFGAGSDEARLLGYAKIAALSKVVGLTCGGILCFLIKSSFNPEPKQTPPEKIP